jgi:lathosterol oxidase
MMTTIGGGLALYWLPGLALDRLYYKRRAESPEAWKVQPERWAPKRLLRQERRLGSFNMVALSAVTGVLLYHVRTGGWTMFYFDVNEHGLPYLLLSTIGFFVVGDFGLYWAHRWMHRRAPYRFMHRVHHRFRTPTAFTALAAHPFELLTFQAITFAPIFLVPLHPIGVISVLIYQHLVSLIDHSGIRFGMLLPWQGPAAFHDDHHTYFHVNFAQTIHWWDRLFGTWRRAEIDYGEERFVVDQGDRPAAQHLSYATGPVRQRSLARLEKKKKKLRVLA